MNIEKYQHPILFYSLATIIPWIFWFAAGHLSHITPSNDFYVVVSSILSFLGLLSPMVIAFSMMLPNKTHPDRQATRQQLLIEEWVKGGMSRFTSLRQTTS